MNTDDWRERSVHLAVEFKWNGGHDLSEKHFCPMALRLQSSSSSKRNELMMYKEYNDVPWYRRSGPLGTITFLGLFFGPAILFACIIALTGDVYTPKKDQSGNLITWSFGIKVAAVIILLVHVICFAFVLTDSLPRLFIRVQP
jgi:hypothetical protein